jgi:hypothetical protein
MATLMSKISRTVRGGKEVARNIRKGCRTLDDDDEVLKKEIKVNTVSLSQI